MSNSKLYLALTSNEVRRVRVLNWDSSYLQQIFRIFVASVSFKTFLTLALTQLKTMAIKSTVVTYVLLFALLTCSFTHARTLHANKFDELRQRAKSWSPSPNADSSFEAGLLLCLNCDPPEVCNNAVEWCPR